MATDARRVPLDTLRMGLRDMVTRESDERLAVTPDGPERVAAGRRRWFAGSTVALGFLVADLVFMTADPFSAVRTLVIWSSGSVFATLYLLGPLHLAGTEGLVGDRDHTPRKMGLLVALFAATIPLIAVGGTGQTSLWIYVGIIAAVLFPMRIALGVASFLAAVLVVVTLTAGAPFPWEVALVLVSLTIWMAVFVNNIRLTAELRRTRHELADAAVSTERARIARDLHDILGHSLTAIAVKAALARRLMGDDAGPVTDEIRDIERLAREALADVRATARGYRDVSLATELAVARSVLDAAGIAFDIPVAVDDVVPAGQAVFGFVVREAVTNVVRHSDADRCVIELEPTRIRIIDNGGGSLDDGTGRGLAGLAERLASVGGTLEATPVRGGGFMVVATVDEHASMGGS